MSKKLEPDEEKKKETQTAGPFRAETALLLVKECSRLLEGGLQADKRAVLRLLLASTKNLLDLCKGDAEFNLAWQDTLFKLLLDESAGGEGKGEVFLQYGTGTTISEASGSQEQSASAIIASGTSSSGASVRPLPPRLVPAASAPPTLSTQSTPRSKKKKKNKQRDPVASPAAVATSSTPSLPNATFPASSSSSSSSSKSSTSIDSASGSESGSSRAAAGRASGGSDTGNTGGGGGVGGDGVEDLLLMNKQLHHRNGLLHSQLRSAHLENQTWNAFQSHVQDIKNEAADKIRQLEKQLEAAQSDNARLKTLVGKPKLDLVAESEEEVRPLEIQNTDLKMVVEEQQETIQNQQSTITELLNDKS